MKIWELKIAEESLQSIIRICENIGNDSFQISREDQGFSVGDEVRLMAWNGTKFTGAYLEAQIHNLHPVVAIGSPETKDVILSFRDFSVGDMLELKTPPDKSSKWNKRFLKLAEHISTWSKDPSTRVGAVIVNDRHQIIGTGYNGFPRGVSDDPARYQNKEIKHEMVVHAEVNAILNAIQPVHGCTIYSTFFPCPRCAAQIIQAGITKVIASKNPKDVEYAERHKTSRTMFNEAGLFCVKVTL